MTTTTGHAYKPSPSQEGGDADESPSPTGMQPRGNLDDAADGLSGAEVIARASLHKGLGNGDTPLEDPHGYEEASDYTMRQRLGLRPVFYANDDGLESHPDQRPCPPWCVRTGTEYGHEIDPGRPFVAEHSTDLISLAASCYRGEFQRDPVRGVAPATIEVGLRQLGQGGQRIDVYLRQERDGEHMFTKQLALSPTDAGELVTVLSYLLAQAEAAEAMRQ